ncbi:GNAT family N-acetyltransferase [Spirillospora sp. NPDC047279]|uniref:GNAT family N-acetyltransferase n=1 Tax=Spirillospora sp. NPDC047279 TaxID=3155478 RepID=UPI00340E000A
MRPPERIALDGMLVRRWIPADVPPLLTAVLKSFESLHPWMPWAAQPPVLREMEAFVESAISQWDTGEAYLYGIFGPDDGHVLGTVGLHARLDTGALEVGYWLHADHTGRGLMTRAARAVTEAGLALPGVERIEIHCDQANVASAAVPRRLAFDLDRVVDDDKDAPAKTGRCMIWIRRRSPAAPQTA